MSSDNTNVEFSVKIMDGVILPQFLSLEKVKECVDLIPDGDDVLLVTYPKTGTNWASQILMLLKNNGVPPQSGEEFLYLCPYLEFTGTDVLKSMSKPRCYKTHMDFAHAPRSLKAKYIVVVRNPKDCLISLFHFVNTSLMGFKGGKFEVLFDLFIKGKTWYNDYFDHVLSWYEHRNDANVLFLYYEKMKADIEQTIKDIGNFLGGDMKRSVEDPKILKDVIRFSSFNYMKKNTNAQVDSLHEKIESEFTEENNLGGTEGVAIENAPLIRKGVVGDWRNVLTTEQNTILDELIERRLKETELYHYWKTNGCI